MAEHYEPSTTTLFIQLRDADNQAAWARFVERYGPVIHRWCQRGNLQEEDAKDIAQTVYARLMQGIHTFDRERGHGRAWLAQVTHNAWLDFLRKRKHAAIGSGDSAVQQGLQELPDPDSLTQAIETTWQQEVLESAMNNVRARCPETRWNIFKAIVLDERKPEEVAREFGITVTAAYQAKFKVQKALREEAHRLGQVILDEPEE